MISSVSDIVISRITLMRTSLLILPKYGISAMILHELLGHVPVRVRLPPRSLDQHAFEGLEDELALARELLCLVAVALFYEFTRVLAVRDAGLVRCCETGNPLRRDIILAVKK